MHEHTFVCTHTHTQTHTCTHISVPSLFYIWMCFYKCGYFKYTNFTSFVWKCSLDTCLHVDMLIVMFVRTYTPIYMQRTCICMCVYVFIYVDICTHKHCYQHEKYLYVCVCVSMLYVDSCLSTQQTLLSSWISTHNKPASKYTRTFIFTLKKWR